MVTIQGLDLFPAQKGLASSLQGFAHTAVFALIAGPVAPLVAGSGWKHALGLAVLMLLSCLAHYGFRVHTARTSRLVPADVKDGQP